MRSEYLRHPSFLVKSVSRYVCVNSCLYWLPWSIFQHSCTFWHSSLSASTSPQPFHQFKEVKCEACGTLGHSGTCYFQPCPHFFTPTLHNWSDTRQIVLLLPGMSFTVLVTTMQWLCINEHLHPYVPCEDLPLTEFGTSMGKLFAPLLLHIIQLLLHLLLFFHPLRLPSSTYIHCPWFPFSLATSIYILHLPDQISSYMDCTLTASPDILLDACHDVLPVFHVGHINDTPSGNQRDMGLNPSSSLQQWIQLLLTHAITLQHLGVLTASKARHTHWLACSFLWRTRSEAKLLCNMYGSMWWILEFPCFI